MNRILLVSLFSLFLAAPVWAGKKDVKCYKAVQKILEGSVKYKHLLTDLDELKSEGFEVKKVSCDKRERGLGIILPNPQKGDKVVKSFMTADITLELLPVEEEEWQTVEKLTISGRYGSYYKEDRKYFDVNEVNYSYGDEEVEDE